MTLQFFLACAAVPAAVTLGTYGIWCAMVRANDGKVGPVGHIHGLALLLGVVAPSAFAWVVWLLWGAWVLATS